MGDTIARLPSVILDPFGGVALGGLDAGLAGMRWLGVELEPRFHALGQDNIALWQRRYGHLPQWVTPTLMQGDSRKLQAVLREQIECCVSSPPYESSLNNPRHEDAGSGGRKNGQNMGYGGAIVPRCYGATHGQLGTEHGTTFWEASKEILAHVYALLKPSGVAVFVLKAYVRNGQLVDFPGDWRRLCESLGFVTLHKHHALLVEEYLEQGLFGEPVAMYRKESKSFFRRLYEKRTGAQRIDYEVVLCMQKPAGSSGGGIATAISSPPYAESWHAAESTSVSEDRMRKGGYTDAYIARQFRASKASGGNLNATSYGRPPGQLGAMPAGTPTT